MFERPVVGNSILSDLNLLYKTLCVHCCLECHLQSHLATIVWFTYVACKAPLSIFNEGCLHLLIQLLLLQLDIKCVWELVEANKTKLIAWLQFLKD